MKKKGMLLLGLLLINFVSAFNGIYSPSDILNNEWAMFAIIFIIVFSFVYFALLTFFSKRVKQEGILALLPQEIQVSKAPALLISIAVALIASAAISQRVRFYGYLGDVFVNWLIFFIIIAVIFIGIAAAFQKGGKKIGVGALIILWIIAVSIDPWEVFPSFILGYNFDRVYYLFANWLVFWVLVIIELFLVFKKQN